MFKNTTYFATSTPTASSGFATASKVTALIALLSIYSVPVFAACDQTTTVETVKKSRGLGKWFGTIIPCLLSLISAEVAIRENKNNPDRKEVVAVAKFMRFFSLLSACFFLDEWIKTDFKEWSFRNSTTCSINS